MRHAAAFYVSEGHFAWGRALCVFLMGQSGSKGQRLVAMRVLRVDTRLSEAHGGSFLCFRGPLCLHYGTELADVRCVWFYHGPMPAPVWTRGAETGWLRVCVPLRMGRAVCAPYGPEWLRV